MQHQIQHFGGRLGYPSVGPEAVSTSSTFLEVVWRRRWVLICSAFACLAGAFLFLALSTKIYSASSTVMIQQNAPKAFSENQGYQATSETFMQTQADVFRSTPVLTRALEMSNYRTLKTFKKVTGDPVAWLRKGSGFKVDVPRKSDVVVISMESVDADEAAAFVNAVVDAFVVEQAQQKQLTGAEMVRVLQKEKAALLRDRDVAVAGMLKAKRDNDVVTFREDKNNTVLERMTSLSSSLTAAEIATIELRAQERATQAALATPQSISAFVTALQAKGKDSGDNEYNELRHQMIQTALAVSTSIPMVGADHPRFRVLQAALDSLKKSVAEKERAIAESQLAAVTALRTVAEEKEKGLREALRSQQGHALALTPAAAAYASHEADAERIQKRCDMLDGRIAEVSVNNIRSAPLNVQVLEQARPSDTPVKPNKVMVMAAAMMLGLIFGLGIAMMRDWQDSCLRRPEEILSVLGTPVVAMVPRISMRLSPVTRGQMVRLDARSPVAEAYRSIRTSLHLGVANKAKTILLASAMEGDGKSTTVSNLGIAFAHTGERTLILDCDLREPVQHLIFEDEGRVGLSSVMAGEATLANAIRPTHVGGLYVLPCGPVPVNPSELLTSKRFKQLMLTLGESFDRIIIDSPPLMMFTDAHILAASCDVTLLVVRMNQSMRQLGAMAMDGLAKVGANVLGAIANDVSPGKAYRKYGGAWQYVTRGERYIGSQNGQALAVVAAGRAKAEAFSISEPDWSADTQ